MSLMSKATAKKMGAMLCATMMVLTIAQTVISNENQKPIAEAGDDVFVDIGITVGFDGTASNDTDGEIVNYTWNFQDGMDYGPTPYHAFDTAGIYLVILMVKDDFDDVGFDSLTVVVRNSPPVAIAEVNETVYEDWPLVFNGTQSTDNYTDIPSLEYYWNFGDGESANGSVVNHTYTRSGTYIASLEVVDNDGAMDIDFVTINVTNLPPICGKGLNKTVQEDDIVSFSPAVFDTISDQPILKYHWNFGDGTVTEGKTAKHVYTKAGTYPVTLTVIDDDGAQSNDTFYVIVENVDPQVEIQDVTETIYEGKTYNFKAVGNDTPTDIPLLNYSWSFGKSGWNGSNIWEDDWSGEISCLVTDDDGATGESSKPVTIENVDPSVSAVDAYLIGDITLRATGEKWHDVKLYLNESGVPREELYVYREPGDPKTQEDTEENVKFALAEECQVSVHYTPLDDPVNGQPTGATPVWVILEFDNGAYRKIHHTFNAEHPETWIWYITLNDYFFLPIDDPECAATGGNPTMHFEYWVFDAGRDGETVTWDFGEASVTQNFAASTFPTEIKSTIDYTPIQLQNITVTAVDDDGGSGITHLYFTDRILDNIAPKAYAEGDTDAEEDTPADFYGSGSDTVSDAGNLEFFWYFGDGETASGQYVEHAYENEGTYMVTLEVSDGTDSTLDAYFIEVQNVAPSANAGNGQTVFEDENALFNGSLSSDTISDKDSLLYSWSFGGLSKGTGITAKHAFSFSDSYEVTLTVIDDNSAIDTDTVTLVVENAIPSVEAVDNLTVNEDQTAFLTCDGNDTASDEPILEYNWSFEVEILVPIPIDNQTGNLTDESNVTYELVNVTYYKKGWNPTFIYSKSGEYTPNVNATDDDLAYATDAANITVVNVPPIAFIGNDMKIFAGIVNISFNATGIDTYSDIDTLEYYWDFGNGNYSDCMNAVYAYTVDGNYTVYLTVTDDDGAIANHSINVTVRIDSDGDGMPDWWEIMHGLDHLDPTGDNGAMGDPDEDFLVNLQEYYYGLHPTDDDTDNDGIMDGNEDKNRNGIVDVGETDPLNPDTDGDGLNDGLEKGLAAPEGQDTTDWQNDTDPLTQTDPLDADTDDDGITDGDEDEDHDGARDEGETDPRLWDTDEDYLSDGLEKGLTEPQHNDTNINLFRADSDNSTTTDPLLPDSDYDGLLDGEEDANHNGSVDPTEPDPNNPDTDDDDVLDGDNNDVIVLTLKYIINWGTSGDFYILMNPEAGPPHYGYRVPEVGAWSVSTGENKSINEIVSVAYYMDGLPVDIRDNGNASAFDWITAEGEFTDKNISGDDIAFHFSCAIVTNSFPDPDPLNNDTDEDGINDYVEAIYLSSRMSDFRVNNTDGDDENRTLLDNTTVFNNLVDWDSDNDGVSDGYEWEHNSDMLRQDTEGDGLGDFDELMTYGTNPCDPDTDWDGLWDLEEVELGLDNNITDPTNNDSDSDGLHDGWEDINHNYTYDIGEDMGEIGDLAQPIPGENRNEGGYGTNPKLNDTDYDGLLDGPEVYFWQQVWDVTFTNDTLNRLVDTNWYSDSDDDDIINILDIDSDNDNITDGAEKRMWRKYGGIPAPGWQDNRDGDKLINIIDPDSDNEGLKDGDEMLIYGTRADEADTDGDGEWSFVLNGKTRWPKSPWDSYHYGTTTQNNVFNDFDEIKYWLGKGKNASEAGANACKNDTDNDGMWDSWEAHYKLNPDDPTGVNGTEGDPDYDGLTNIQEYLPDGINVRYNLFPTDGDTDNDGLYDGFKDLGADGLPDTNDTGEGDGIWNDYGEDGLPDTNDTGEGDGLWQDGEEEWGEIGDPDTPTNSYAGGYGLLPNDSDTDNDAFGYFYDGAEVDWWQTEKNCDSTSAGLNANNSDVDSDTMKDGWEGNYYPLLDPAIDDGNEHADSDTLTNVEEWNGWNVSVWRPGYTDQQTLFRRSDPTDTNSDSDDLNDLEEKSAGTDPTDPDTDRDLLDDYWEKKIYLTNPLDADSDDDGLSDSYEITYLGNVDTDGDKVKNPWDPDSDGDGLKDGWDDLDNDLDWDSNEPMGEVGDPDNAHRGGYDTEPLIKNTDNDGLGDGDEVAYWATIKPDAWKTPYDDDGQDNNLRDDDADDDTLLDGDEVNTYMTLPYEEDTDNDNLPDGVELNYWASIPGVDWDDDLDTDGKKNLVDDDSDADGLKDGDEVNTYLTIPYDTDSDNDGLYDGWGDTNHNLVFDEGEERGEVGDQNNEGGYGTVPANSHSPGIYGKYDAVYNTRDYGKNDVNFCWDDYGLARADAVIRRGTTFTLGGPDTASMPSITPGYLSVTDAGVGQWNIEIETTDPIGVYTVTLTDGGWSKTFTLYVIFELSATSGTNDKTGLTATGRDAWCYDETSGLDEISYFYSGTEYELHPFDKEIVTNVLENAVNYWASQYEAMIKLGHTVNNLIEYSYPMQSYAPFPYDILTLYDARGGVTDAVMADAAAGNEKRALRGNCWDYANLLVSYARSIGIPSRVVTGTNLQGDDVRKYPDGTPWNNYQMTNHAWIESWVVPSGESTPCWFIADPTGKEQVFEGGGHYNWASYSGSVTVDTSSVVEIIPETPISKAVYGWGYSQTPSISNVFSWEDSFEDSVVPGTGTPDYTTLFVFEAQAKSISDGHVTVTVTTPTTSHSVNLFDTTEIKWVYHSQERGVHTISVTGGTADIYFYERNTYDPWSTTLHAEEISWQGPACKRSDWKTLSGYGDPGINQIGGGIIPTKIFVYKDDPLNCIYLTGEYEY